MSRRPRTPLVVALVAAAGLLAGCGMKGTPTPAEIDVRTLDVGSYPVDRHSYDQNAHGRGALLEGMRMAQAVAPTVRIDPSLSVGQGSSIIADSSAAINHLLAGVSKPVLDNRRMMVGFVAGGSDIPDAPGPNATAVTNLVMRFPDATTATLAARELEDADFGVAPDVNRKLALAQYPDAFIHYRPGVPTIGAFLAHKEFVISLFIERPQADESDLLSWVRKTLDAEMPALDAFQPTSPSGLDALRVDPDGLLARTVVRDRGDRTPDPDHFAVYGPSAFVHTAPDEAARQRLVDDTGMDAIAIADASSVLRVRDEAAGPRLINGLITSAGPEYEPTTAPNQVPGAKCLQLNRTGDNSHESRFRCYVPYRRYVEVVTGDDKSDIRQQVAAAYALLANSF
jgi:hypothetical protein